MDKSDASGPYDLDREAQRIQLRTERLGADTETVMAGDARVETSVRSTARTLEIACVRETATVERRSVNHGAAEPIGTGQRVVIRLSAEQPSIAKKTIVTEEVIVGRRRVASTQHFTDVVRHEELRVAYDESADGLR